MILVISTILLSGTIVKINYDRFKKFILINIHHAHFIMIFVILLEHIFINKIKEMMKYMKTKCVF